MKQILYLLLILTSSFVFADRNIDIPQPADLDLVEEKLLLEAIEIAQEAVQNFPDDADVWGQLAHVYLIHGWETPAIPCYRRASLLAPKEFRWFYFLGRLTKERQPEEAVKHLTRALMLNAEYAPAHLYLASALRILGKLEDARHHLERAKHLQPSNPFSELWLGEIALARQQLKLAKRHLENALRLNPRQSEAHALMAQIVTALGDKQAAKRHAQAARSPSQYGELSDPLWWDVLQAGVTAALYAERGRRYMSEGDYTSAVAEFETLISDEQKDIKVWFDYGVSLLYTAQHHEALAVLEHLLLLLDKDIEIQKQRSTDERAYLKAQAHNYIGQIYYETGQTAAAIRACRMALQFKKNITDSESHGQLNPSDYATFFSNVHANLATVYENTGQLGEAIRHYQAALELVPSQLSAHRALAGVYWKKQRYTAAEPHYKQVITHDATDVQAIYRLGLIFLTKKDYLEAISLFKKVIAIEATHVRAYGALGVAYQELGNIPEAIGAFERVLELEPGNKVVLDKLRELHKLK
ncbi:tetratricopeptide repeat protein [Candidatus Poribacteria bacterium]|nr:tetratricopeptide repeat protein [Candidatus Poribacteria bacterium]MYA99436.1 tetratricopeptide repeat protein [Candidatus Poribacteria bacterium]